MPFTAAQKNVNSNIQNTYSDCIWGEHGRWHSLLLVTLLFLHMFKNIVGSNEYDNDA